VSNIATSTHFQSIGIIHRLSYPHTHQQEGCAERKHGHLIDTTLALLVESNLPTTFWDEACLTSCYLLNRLPTPLLKNKSPFQKLFNRTPDYTFLKIFGCACFPNLLSVPKNASSSAIVLIIKVTNAITLSLAACTSQGM
jgi:hypothetical protein